MKAVFKRGEGEADYLFDPVELAGLYRRLPSQIIADLNVFCFGDTPTFDPDDRIDARNSGRRDVWLHINKYLKLQPEQIEDIFRGRGHVIYNDDEAFDG